MESFYDCEAYACFDKDDENIAISSSGGMFSQLASKILNDGGVVAGAAFDENLEVSHIFIEDINDLYKLRTSKYVQSNTKDIYQKAKYYLDNGRIVLFSGTPCQIGGLRSFLGDKKDDENLYTVDIICHGVPSPLIFSNHIKEIENEFGKIKKINFRDKTNGWAPLYIKFEFDNPAMNYIKSSDEDEYFYGFLKNIFLRESCYNCQFHHTYSGADITIGDYWNIRSEHPHMWNDNKGVSAVIVKTKKGKSLFDACKNSLHYIPSTVEQIARYNIRIAQPTIPYSSMRHNFFDTYKKNGMNLKKTYEHMPTVSFGIIGSYASRSIVHQFSAREGGKITFQISNSSLVSFMGKASKAVMGCSFDDENPYRKEALTADVKKELPFDNLEKASSCDYIFIDFLEERYPLLENEGCYITLSEAMKDSEIKHLEKEWNCCPESDRSKKWQAACTALIEKLLSIYRPEQIILNRIYLAEEYFDGETSHAHDNLEKIKKFNKELQQYYDFFETHCPNCVVLDGSGENYTPLRYPHGCHPQYHNSKYYITVAKRLAGALHIVDINIDDLNPCTGCGACYQKCSCSAITMQPAADGFYYPVLDKNRCTKCGQCYKACPVGIKLF